MCSMACFSGGDVVAQLCTSGYVTGPVTLVWSRGPRGWHWCHDLLAGRLVSHVSISCQVSVATRDAIIEGGRAPVRQATRGAALLSPASC